MFDSHTQQLLEARQILHTSNPRIVTIALDDQDRAYWGTDVPKQMCSDSTVDAYECPDDRVKAHIWEQFAYAFKLVSSGVTRTVALEFDFNDLHMVRPESSVRTEAKQIAKPLARLIARLKEANLYERTVIAVYTLDGSRSPRADSYGNDGKNTLILAGGKIRGGYWGDIRLTDQGSTNGITYHPPDPESGEPTGSFQDVEGRLDSARVWRTVMKAAGVPDSAISEYTEVASAQPMPFVLRG